MLQYVTAGDVSCGAASTRSKDAQVGQKFADRDENMLQTEKVLNELTCLDAGRVGPPKFL